MIYLRNSTTSQEVALGQFVSSTDGNTEQSVTTNTVYVWLAGTTSAITVTAGTIAITGGSLGMHYTVLDEGHTGTNGSGAIFVHPTGSLPVRVDFTILPQQVYDSLISGTDLLQADTVQWNNTSVSASYLMPVIVRQWDTVSVSALNIAVIDASARVNANVQQWAGSSVSTNNIAILATLAKTTQITGFNDVSKGSISSVVFSSQMAEGYAVTTSAMTLPQALYGLWSFLTQFTIAGTTYTTKKLDKATTAMTFSLDDATTPHAITRET